VPTRTSQGETTVGGDRQGSSSLFDCSCVFLLPSMIFPCVDARGVVRNFAPRGRNRHRLFAIFSGPSCRLFQSSRFRRA
jgi:hypothetical protein